MTLAIVVGLAGGIGSAARYLIDGAVQGRTRGVFPFGTLSVNVAGSFLLGLLTGLALYDGLTKAPKAVIGTGFCGGLTTWSTASWQTVRLAEEGATGQAAGNALGGLALSIAAAAAGIAIVALV
jgi:fluoride exporter